MAKDHGSSIKDDKQYKGLRKKGMSKQRAAASPTTRLLEQGGKASGSGKRRNASARAAPRPEGGRRPQGRRRPTARA